MPINVPPDAPRLLHQGRHLLFPEDVVFLDGQFVRGRDKKDGIVTESKFRHILEGLKEIYEVDCVIAGGAVRDLMAGWNTCKDIDVWLPISWDKFDEHQLELGWQHPAALAVKKKRVENYTEIHEVSNNAIATVQGVNVDLVFLEKPLDADAVNKFPIYAQRCVYTLNEGMTASPEALQDLANKTFTIDPSIDNEERLNNLRAKIKQWQQRPFYKDWKIAGERKAWWEKKDQEDEEMKKKTLAEKDKYSYNTIDTGSSWSTIWTAT